MAPELYGLLAAVAYVGAAIVCYCAYYATLWLVFAGCMALDRQLHAPDVFIPAERLPSPELRAMYPNGYTVPAGLSPLAYTIGMGWKYIGTLMNFVGNLGLTLVFLELPREFAITIRITRWIERGPEGWRKRLAVAFADTFFRGLDWRGIHRAG